MRLDEVKDSLLRQIAEVAGRFGIALLGIADVEGYWQRWPEALLDIPPYFPRAVVMAHPLLRGVLSTVKDRPTHLYFHHYRQVNYVLDRAALAVGEVIERGGYRALPVAASQTLDKEDLVAHISHRHQFGSAVRLVSVLTDAPFEPGRPLEGDPCEGCGACIKACPAGAIHETRDKFDLRGCHEKLSEFRKIPRIGQRICGVCQRFCPAGRGKLPKNWPVIVIEPHVS